MEDHRDHASLLCGRPRVDQRESDAEPVAAALLIVVVGLLLAPLALALYGHRAAAGTLILFLLLTRLSDLGISAHGVSDVNPAGLSQVSQVCLAALAALAVARRIRAARAGHGFVSTRPWLAMGIYLAVVLASSIWAAAGPLATGQAVSLIKNLVIAYVIVELLDSPGALRLALWGALAAGVLMAGLTVIQAATHTYSNPYLGLAQAPVRQIVGTDNSFRSAGPIGDPNFYGLVLAVLVPVSLMRLRDEDRPLLRAAAGAATLLLLAAIVLTYSRGGLVTVAASFVMFVILTRTRATHIALAALVALPLIPFVPPTYWERIGTISQGDNSIANRESSQAVALQMFIRHPLGGVGADNYPVAYLPYALRLNEPAAAEEPHNLYLAVAAETGLLGITAFIAAQALVLRYAWKRRKAALNRNDRLAEGLATSVILMLLTYLVGVAFLPIAYPRYLWLLVGLTLVAPASVLVRSERHHRQPTHAQSAAL
jgi:putative inorganic carbon (HCO3(-)) transporter